MKKQREKRAIKVCTFARTAPLFSLLAFNLVYMPCSELYQKALSDSLIKSFWDNLNQLNTPGNLEMLDGKKEIMSISDVFALMRGKVTEEKYGILHRKIIKDFLDDEKSITGNLRVVFKPDLKKTLDYYVPRTNLRHRLFYIIRVIAFLRQKYHKIKEYENTKYVTTGWEDQMVFLELDYIKYLLKSSQLNVDEIMESIKADRNERKRKRIKNKKIQKLTF